MAGPRWTIGVGTLAVGLSLVAVAIYFYKRDTVRVTYESVRRPRFQVSIEEPNVPEPQAVR